MKPIIFITGTGTGTGKTVLTALLAQSLRERAMPVAALKPLCSGGRADARALHAALAGALTLDEINPWHFRDPIAPLLAARRENKKINFATVCRHIRDIQKRHAVTLVEGAGGLLSPLGESFDSRDLILALRAIPLIVAPNQLGVINHLLLTLAALPPKFRAQSKVVLMSPARPDAATGTNAALLAESFPKKNIFTLPWLGQPFSPAKALKRKPVPKALATLLHSLRIAIIKKNSIFD